MIDNLRRTLDELSKRQALAAVGEYAAALSHEVRNGLTAVRVDLQRAEEKTPGDAPGRPLIGRALANVKRIEGTVTTSLRVARGGRTPHRRLELHPMLRTAAQSAESVFSERGGTVSLQADRVPRIWVLGDATALQQLFVNLLLNAAQAIGEGGSATISVLVEGPEIVVAIRDNGAGIAAENLDHVLEPFFSTRAEGTGLGLSVARQAAAAHGGSLRISSVSGDGTTVEVRLPLSSAPST